MEEKRGERVTSSTLQQMFQSQMLQNVSSRTRTDQTYEDEMWSDELVSLAYTFSTQFLEQILFWILSI